MPKRIVQLTIALLALNSMSVLAKSEAPHAHKHVIQERHTPKAKERVKPSRTLKDFIDRHCTKKCVDPRKLGDVVAKASAAHHVPEKLILSVIRVESAFKKQAISGNQIGSMQIILRWHGKRFKGRNPVNLAANVDVGAEILSECLERKKGSMDKAARCYNSGFIHTALLTFKTF